MSQSGKKVAPPFLQGKQPRARAKTLVTKPGDVAPSTVFKTPPAKTSTAPTAKDSQVVNVAVPHVPSPKSKKQRTEEAGSSQLVYQPPSNATPVQLLFAKHGYRHASENQCAEWTRSGLTESYDATSKCLAEAFIRHSSHQQALHAVLADNSSLTKEVQMLRSKMEADRKSWERMHRETLETETATLKAELISVQKEAKALGKSLTEAEKRAEDIKLDADTDRAKLLSELEAKDKELEGKDKEREVAVDEALAQGQIDFMKTFIKSVPDFDWDKLGPGNAEYAESLRLEIEEEARQLAAQTVTPATEQANPDQAG